MNKWVHMTIFFVLTAQFSATLGGTMMSIGANFGRPTSSRIELLFIREHIPDNNA
jgi:hypothetical protein